MTKTEIDAMKAQRKDLILKNRKYKKKMRANAWGSRSLSSEINKAEKERKDEFSKMIDGISKEDKKTIHDLSNMTNGDFSVRSIASYAGAATKARTTMRKKIYPSFPNLCHEKKTVIKRMVEIDERGHIVPNTEQDVKLHTHYYFTEK